MGGDTWWNMVDRISGGKTLVDGRNSLSRWRSLARLALRVEIASSKLWVALRIEDISSSTEDCGIFVQVGIGCPQVEHWLSGIGMALLYVPGSAPGRGSNGSVRSTCCLTKLIG